MSNYEYYKERVCLMASKIKGLEISNKLLEQIKNIVNGNQVKSSEVTYFEHQYGPIKIELNINWLFRSNSSSRTYKGSYPTANHFSNKLDQTRHVQNLLVNSQNDQSQWGDFINRLITDKNNAISYSNHTQCIKNYGRFSYIETCGKCNGYGNISCHGCNGSGNGKCGGCGGGGSRMESVNKIEYRTDNYGRQESHYTTAQEWKTCSGCGGSGNSKCQACQGSGSYSCNNCSGKGCFTIVTDVWLDAIPSSSILVESKFRVKESLSYFNSKYTTFFLNNFPLKFINYDLSNANNAIFNYIGENELVELWFLMKKKKYVVLSFGDSPIAFYKPPLFDDLFDDELKELQSLYDDNKGFNRSNAFNLFNHYKKQPVLNEALLNIAENHTSKNNSSRDIIVKACCGYITKEKSKLLAKAMNGLLEKLSPAYSSLSWMFFGFVFIASIMLFIVYGMESKFLPLKGLFLKIFIISFLILIIASIIPIVFSHILTKFKASKIPKEYRQKIKVLKPAKKYAIASLLGIVTAFSYGNLSIDNQYYPKIGIWVFEKFGLRKHFEKGYQYRPEKYRSLNSKKGLSDNEKVRYIQQFLYMQGYKINIDGVLGSETKRVLNDFFKSNKILSKLTPNDENINWIYENFKLMDEG